MSVLVTLTTDFGEREPTVAEIKGIIFSGCPEARVVDLGHDIARGDVMETALFAFRTIPRFPEGTIHMVNVAPGPKPLAVSLLGQVVVCPDNGALTMLARHHEIQSVRQIEVSPELSSQPGQIYYGRDVFAPVVARLAAGAEHEELGPALDGIELLDVAQPEQASDSLVTGQIIHVDRFGNLVTNIHVSDLANQEIVRIEAGGFPLGPLRCSYSEVQPNSPLALLGASGFLEVAYNGDRADERLDFGPGIRVRVEVKPSTS